MFFIWIGIAFIVGYFSYKDTQNLYIYRLSYAFLMFRGFMFVGELIGIC